MKRMITVIVLALVTPLAVVAQPASLIKDVASAGPGAGLDVASPVKVGSILFFVGTEDLHGSELWKTDGTAAGTLLVKDITPGTSSSQFKNLIEAGGQLFFLASSTTAAGNTRNDLWRSDGTASGTTKLASFGDVITPVSFGGALYFSATAVGSTSPYSIWKSDGTVDGTTMSSNRAAMNAAVGFNGVLYFTGYVVDEVFPNGGASTRSGLWRISDFNVGVELIKATTPDSFAGPSSFGLLTVGNGRLFFSNSRVGRNSPLLELWTSDGTSAGTTSLKSFPQGTGPFATQLWRFFSQQGSTYFVCSGLCANELWKTDGTTGGTILLKALGEGVSSGYAAAGARIVFSGIDAAAGAELWASDGTPAGTGRLVDLFPGTTGSAPADFIQAGGVAYFTANDGTGGRELWKTDGTVPGTVRVKDIRTDAAGSAPRSLAEFANSLFFCADDGVNGSELWKSDGTSAGTVQVSDTRGGSSAPASAVLFNGKWYFAASDGVTGTELWASDGTAAGTTLVKDINPGGLGSSPASLMKVGTLLFFVADDGTNGPELWKTDGTTTNTLLVSDVRPGASGASLLFLTDLSGVLFFVADDGTNGAELWKSDGTPAGTGLVKDICSGSCGSSPGGFRSSTGVVSFPSPLSVANFNGALFFSADDGVTGAELWRSDGTPAGTVMVKDIIPQTGHGAFPRSLTVMGNALFFLGYEDPVSPTYLWKTDGTAAGTVRVTTGYNPHFATESGVPMVNAGGVLLFGGVGSAEKTGLWRSDGTAAGTFEVRTIAERSYQQYAQLRDFTMAGSTLFFTADDWSSGRELWKTDGTPSGTVMVRDIRPGRDVTTSLSDARGASPDPASLTLIGSSLFFSADDGVHGRELWQSDGTTAGTRMVQDVAPGLAPSSPTSLSAGPAGLFFAANDGVVGREPWLLRPTVDVSDSVSVTESPGGGTASFTVTLSFPSATAVVVGYATSDGSAVSPGDYQGAPGTLTFLAGETSKAITVPVIDDLQSEVTEGFGLTLTSASGATLGRKSAVATILDNDSGSAGRPQPQYHAFFAVDTLETPYVGDFNGDARADIITFTRQNPSAIGDVYVALSEGTKFGANTKWHDFFAITTDETVVIGDYDGDGKDDIGTWLGKTTKQVYVARSLGNGMTPEIVWVNSIGKDPSDVIVSGDANGDGKDDLIDFARKEGKVYVALSTGTSFSTPALWHGFFAISTDERPRVADLNGDGKVDIVTFATNSPTAFGDVYVSLSTGTRFGDNDSSVKWHDFFAIRPEEEVRIGDLNGDGRDDFFTFLPPPFAQCYTALSQGTAMGESVLWPEAIAPDTKDGKYVGDVTGDGKADIIIFAQGEGRVYVSLAR